MAAEKLNTALSKVIVCERVLLALELEFFEVCKVENPILYNLLKKDLQTLERNHKYFYDRIQPIVKGTDLLDDFELIYKQFNKYD